MFRMFAKSFAKFAIMFAMVVNFAFATVPVFAETTFNTPVGDKKTNVIATDHKDGKTSVDINDFWNSFQGWFFGGGNSANQVGEKGAYNLIVNIAYNAKNAFIVIAVVFLIIASVKLLFAKGWDDDIKKWKNSFAWTAIGIIVMQIAYVFIVAIFDKGANGFTAMNLLDGIIYPFIRLLEMIASFVFLAIAVYSFFLMVTAGGSEDGIKKGKSGIINGLLGFALIKIPAILVRSVYGSAKCTTENGFLGVCKISDPNLGETVSIMTTAVNYVNAFLGIITVLLIIYAGFLMVTSWGDEEKTKKAKKIIIYIAIGIILLVSSYMLFNFFLQKG